MFVKILGDFFSCAVLIKISKIDIRAHIENRSELSWVQVSHRKTTGMFVFMPRFAYWIYQEKNHTSLPNWHRREIAVKRQAGPIFNLIFHLFHFDVLRFKLLRSYSFANVDRSIFEPIFACGCDLHQGAKIATKQWH